MKKIACRYGKNGYFGICRCDKCDPKNKSKPSPLQKLAWAYKNNGDVSFTRAEVQQLVTSDNALQSLIEEWHI